MRQLATGRQGGQEDPLSAFGVQAQRLDVNARANKVFEQRDLVDVDGQKFALRQSDQRKRDAAAGGGHAGRDRWRSWFEPFGCTYFRIAIRISGSHGRRYCDCAPRCKSLSELVG